MIWDTKSIEFASTEPMNSKAVRSTNLTQSRHLTASSETLWICLRTMWNLSSGSSWLIEPDNRETKTNPESPRLKDDKLFEFFFTSVSWQQAGPDSAMLIGLLPVLSFASLSKPGTTSSDRFAIELSDESESGFAPFLISNIRNRPLPRPIHTSFRLGRIAVIRVLFKWEI